MRSLIILSLAIPSLATADVIAEGAGIIYGKDHVFSLKAPRNWALDNTSAVKSGLHAVFFPTGSTWAESKVVAYARARPIDKEVQSVNDAVDAVIERATERKFQWLSEHYPVMTEKLSGQDFIDIRNELISHHPELLIDLSELRIRSIEAAAIHTGFSGKEARTLAEQAFEVFIAERNDVELFPHAEACLAQLSKRYTLIALTNGNADLAAIGIDHYFTAHYKPMDAGAAKPDPAMFEKALRTANVSAANSVHVGDDLVCDIEAAKQLGMKVIFSNILDKNSPESEALADASIGSLKELPALIDSLLE